MVQRNVCGIKWYDNNISEDQYNGLRSEENIPINPTLQ